MEDETVSRLEDENHKPSHLFTVRIWPEVVEDDKTEWRGKVHHVASGTARYFRSWEALVEFLQRTLGQWIVEAGAGEAPGESVEAGAGEAPGDLEKGKPRL